MPTRTPCSTCTPFPTRTPPAISLNPRVQFGHGTPGGTVAYHEVLSNHFLTDTLVSLSGSSHGGWGVAVNPSSVTVHDGVTATVNITVSLPSTSTRWCDIERISAVGGSPAYTATAYLLTISSTHRFADMPLDHWASDSVEYLLSQDIISGYSDNTFRPNNEVTRSQFAKILVGAYGWDIITPATPTFNDVPADNWAYGYIETASAHGVISGYNDGSFRPSNSITRAQVAKMVVNASGWVFDGSARSTYSDVDETDWAYNYIQTVSAADVMSGYSDNTFRPYATATRAQIAKILTYSLFSDPNE
jgi:hypothetical protein